MTCRASAAVRGSSADLLDSCFMPADETTPGARRPTWVRISLDSLRHNYRTIRKNIGPTIAVMAVVKANAYGHGAVECSRALEAEGADWFGVALPEEGIELRQAGISSPILCLGGFWEDQEDVILEHHLTPVIFGLDSLIRLDHAARRAGVVADYHLKVDTGMGRLGVTQGRLDEFLESASSFKNVRLDGAMTHFASADDPAQNEFTRQQRRLFSEAVAKVRARGHEPRWIH